MADTSDGVDDSLPRFVYGATYWRGLSPLSATLFQFALVYSLCASFDAAGQPLEKRVLMECEKSFYKEVAVMEVYRELCQKHVIPQTVADKITKSHSVEEARGYLFDHMRDYGTLATLKAFCDVITSEKYDGFPEMQEFGTEMRRRLEQEGRCVCVCACVCDVIKMAARRPRGRWRRPAILLLRLTSARP